MRGRPNILGWGYAALMLFLWVTVAVDYQHNLHRTVVRIEKRKYELNKIILRIVFFVLWFMAAFRGMDITNDTDAYYRTYRSISSYGFAGETRMEVGYVALNVFLSHVFKDDLLGFHVLLFVTATFSYFALEQWIERHTDTYGICIVAFYFLSNQSFMSAIRQSMALGFVLCALMAYEDVKGRKRYIIYVLLVYIASLFHKTCIVSLVFPFLTKRPYTRNTTLLIVFFALFATSTNFVSKIIYFLGMGKSYITTETGNAVNAGVMSILFLSLLALRMFSTRDSGALNEKSKRMNHSVYGDSFFTYCIAFSLAVTAMSLRAPGMSRLNIYFQLVGLPYVSNVMNHMENQRAAFIVKLVYSMAIWGYSVIALVYRPEWQHIWPYHFYWQ